MVYSYLSMDEKKRILKSSARRFYFHVIQSAIFWVIIGFVISTVSMGHVLVSSLNALDKVMVCK